MTLEYDVHKSIVVHGIPL